MITVRKELTCPIADQAKAKAVVNEYKQLFDPSPSCRIYLNASGNVHHFYIDDDYESLADYEVRWPERTATPEFQTWLKKWFALTVDGSYEVNILCAIE